MLFKFLDIGEVAFAADASDQCRCFGPGTEAASCQRCFQVLVQRFDQVVAWFAAGTRNCVLRSLQYLNLRHVE